MTRTHRLSTTGALVVCLIATQWSGTLFASQDERPSNATPSEVQTSTGEPTHLVFNDQVFVENPSFGLPRPQLLATPVFAFSDAEGLGQRGGYRGRNRNGAATAAIVLGSAAAIGGGAVLVYANRPECSANHAASGCGYGAKVTGTAVLSAGIVALIVGALSWR
jgi:hypothetical protein